MVNNSTSKGFTVVEALAAIVIAATVTSLILSFLTSSIKSFKVTEGALQLQNEAQFTMNIWTDNIMSCSQILSAKDSDTLAINISEELLNDSSYILSSISFLKVINQERYVETYDFNKDDKAIYYSLTKEGAVSSEVSGVFASNIDESGFILHGIKGKSIDQTNFINIELRFDFDGQKLSLTNTARYRNTN
jgi:type II secretory pathway pseudopilin PulG